MKPWTDADLQAFLRVIDPDDNATGGGTASAVAGAMAAGLAGMVARLSVGKDGMEPDPYYHEIDAEAQVLTLAPGRYIFRVTNLDVPYELGFWLREHDYNWKNPIHKLTKTSISGGGLITGATMDYEVELEPGEYLYSCPLNPTPDYKLVVAN